MPVSRFADPHRAGSFARGNDDVTADQGRGDKAVELTDGHGKISIAHETVITSSFQDASPDSQSFTSLIFRKYSDYYAVARFGRIVLFSEFLGDCQRAIVAAVF